MALSIIIVAIVHGLLHLSDFIKPDTECLSTDPTLASWLFVIAVFQILRSDCLYLVHYMPLPPILRTIIEIIIALLLTEFGVVFVWYKIENLTCYLTKSLLIGLDTKAYIEYGYYILGAATTLVCLAFLIVVNGVCRTGKDFICNRKRELREDDLSDDEDLAEYINSLNFYE
uniref:Uncharacterized protein n=1 Tax=Glossina pallidipes TaxID=7398 RepID=A0A1B0A138_GLOPL